MYLLQQVNLSSETILFLNVFYHILLLTENKEKFIKITQQNCQSWPIMIGTESKKERPYIAGNLSQYFPLEVLPSICHQMSWNVFLIFGFTFNALIQDHQKSWSYITKDHEKMQLDVEGSPPANGVQMSNLQIHNGVKVIIYKAWLLKLTKHITENADAFGQILMFEITTGWGKPEVSAIFSSRSRLVLQ